MTINYTEVINKLAKFVADTEMDELHLEEHILRVLAKNPSVPLSLKRDANERLKEINKRQNHLMGG